jgi:hypothetical protein
VIVTNAQHIKAVPGRKTDVQDADWIADLLQHGLLRASFVPSQGTKCGLAWMGKGEHSILSLQSVYGEQ